MKIVLRFFGLNRNVKMNVKILDLLCNSTDDCNAMYFVVRNKVFYFYFVISIQFYFLLTLTSRKPDWNTYNH